MTLPIAELIGPVTVHSYVGILAIFAAAVFATAFRARFAPYFAVLIYANTPSTIEYDALSSRIAAIKSDMNNYRSPDHFATAAKMQRELNKLEKQLNDLVPLVPKRHLSQTPAYKWLYWGVPALCAVLVFVFSPSTLFAIHSSAIASSSPFEANKVPASDVACVENLLSPFSVPMSLASTSSLPSSSSVSDSAVNTGDVAYQSPAALSAFLMWPARVVASCSPVRILGREDGVGALLWMLVCWRLVANALKVKKANFT